MIALPENTDPVFKPKATRVSWYEQLLLSLIVDPRDLRVVKLLVYLNASLLVSILLLTFYQGKYWWLLALLFFTWFHLRFHGPYVLTIHVSSHRRVFKKNLKWADFYLTQVMCFFFGQSPKTYFNHHILMHHLEENNKADISSTMSYQRDSFFHFIWYYIRFWAFTAYQLFQYFKDKGNKQIKKEIVISSILYWIVLIGVCLIAPKYGILYLLAPYILSKIMLPMGNWVQHAFIDPNDPYNAYRNSITCINNRYNHLCWNDGYHTQHHLRPGLHWTKYPEAFRANLDAYKRERAFVFSGLDYFQIFFLLMFKRYQKLADHFVNVGGQYSSEEELIQEFKTRLTYIPA